MPFLTSCGARLVSKIFNARQRGWAAMAIAVPLFWYGVFEWHSIEYPSYNRGPCYSPNHHFYVTRHQTIWQAFTTSSQDDFGMARLFDQSGNLLYEKETPINEEFGPEWSAGFEDDPSHRPSVFYQGIDEPGWTFTLPASPGNGRANQNCYPNKLE